MDEKSASTSEQANTVHQLGNGELVASASTEEQREAVLRLLPNGNIAGIGGGKSPRSAHEKKATSPKKNAGKKSEKSNQKPIAGDPSAQRVGVTTRGRNRIQKKNYLYFDYEVGETEHDRASSKKRGHGKKEKTEKRGKKKKKRREEEEEGESQEEKEDEGKEEEIDIDDSDEKKGDKDRKAGENITRSGLQRCVSCRARNALGVCPKEMCSSCCIEAGGSACPAHQRGGYIRNKKLDKLDNMPIPTASDPIPANIAKGRGRGRGRPAKIGRGRGRGRPARDATSGNGRGKVKKEELALEEAKRKVPVPTTPVIKQKGRPGRPRKVRPEEESNIDKEKKVQQEELGEVPSLSENDLGEQELVEQQIKKRGRGRPKKNALSQLPLSPVPTPRHNKKRKRITDLSPESLSDGSGGYKSKVRKTKWPVDDDKGMRTRSRLMTRSPNGKGVSKAMRNRKGGVNSSSRGGFNEFSEESEDFSPANLDDGDSSDSSSEMMLDESGWPIEDEIFVDTEQFLALEQQRREREGLPSGELQLEARKKGPRTADKGGNHLDSDIIERGMDGRLQRDVEAEQGGENVMKDRGDKEGRGDELDDDDEEDEFFDYDDDRLDEELEGEEEENDRREMVEGEGMSRVPNGRRKKFVSRRVAKRQTRLQTYEREGPMSYNDKRELCRDVADLRGTGHMTKILKIIACQLPRFIGERQMNAEALDIDINGLSPATLYRIEQYVYAVARPSLKRKPPLKSSGTAHGKKKAPSTPGTKGNSAHHRNVPRLMVNAESDDMLELEELEDSESAVSDNDDEYQEDSEEDAFLNGQKKKKKIKKSPKKNTLILPPKKPQNVSPTVRPRRTRKLRLYNRHEVGAVEKNELSEPLQRCQEIVSALIQHKYGWVFATPVDPVLLNIPDYFDVVKNPMDLGTVKTQLESGHYETPPDFAEDVRLVWYNALLYNPERSDIHEVAKELQETFERAYEPIGKDWEKNIKIHEERQRRRKEKELRQQEKEQKEKEKSGNELAMAETLADQKEVEGETHERREGGQEEASKEKEQSTGISITTHELKDNGDKMGEEVKTIEETGVAGKENAAESEGGFAIPKAEEKKEESSSEAKEIVAEQKEDEGEHSITTVMATTTTTTTDGDEGGVPSSEGVVLVEDSHEQQKSDDTALSPPPTALSLG